MPDGTVLILNGVSSSGKSSIVRAWQDALPEPYLEAGLDKFIWMLPHRYLDRPLWDDVLGLADRAGDTGHALVSGMHRSIAALSRAGMCVVADHVLVEPVWVRECASWLADLPAFLVAVYCPLDVLERREQERRDRTLGQARRQFDRVHAHRRYDLWLDTSVSSPGECVEQIRRRMQDGPPCALKQLVADGAGF